MYAFFEVEIVSLKGVFLVEGGGAMPPGPLLFLFDTLGLASMNKIYNIDDLLIDFLCVYCKQKYFLFFC